jgi:hypothetical protein
MIRRLCNIVVAYTDVSVYTRQSCYWRIQRMAKTFPVVLLMFLGDMLVEFICV